MPTSIPRRSFLLLALTAFVLLGGCGFPAHIDPPLFEREVSPNQLALEATLHARDLPGGHGYASFVMDTHSMEPALKGGDYVVIAGPSNRTYESLKAGEIIVYKADWLPKVASPVAHRLVSKDKDGWILSGDNNARTEAAWRVTEKTYLGAVVARYRIKKVG